ncbi:MAG: SsrA-binding protein [candidate division CPR2 bacterium GW2011_GWC1_39_9]|nr:MAG: SsrA-binding protein [candidate division CPR2 bacterium GW2011_GWC1_39_9]
MVGIKIITQNRRGLFDYEINEKFEAGIVLTGPEVKSVKSGHINLKDSYAVVKDEEIWLLNTHIANYKNAGDKNYEPERSRKLLLSKKEIKSLIGKLEAKGFTLIPLKIYLKHGLIKVELGLGRGRKNYDKREVIKRREVEREIQKEIKERMK